MVSSWYRAQITFCCCPRLQILLQACWILAVRPETLGRSQLPRWCFCIALVTRTEGGTDLCNSVFCLPAYLPALTQVGRREPLKEDQAWLSLFSRLLQLFILWPHWGLGFSQSPLSDISCLLLDGRKRSTTFFSSYHSWGICSPCATEFDFPPLITSHFSTSNLLVLLSQNSRGWHGIVTTALIRDRRMQL